MSNPKIQHTVPRFILNNFCNPKKQKIFVFDKHTQRTFETNVKNIASEKGFYDFELKGQKLTLEPGLANLESKSSKIIDRVVSTKTLSNLTDEEKVTLAYFIATQFNRTSAVRLRYKTMNEVLKQKIIEFGFDPQNTQGYSELSENDIKLLTNRMILRGDFLPHFLSKVWMLFETTDNRPYYISDNPIVLQNMNDLRPYGNLGLACKGIEIYFPLSRSLTLAMLCKSHEKTLKDTYENYLTIKSVKPELLAENKYDPEILLRYVDSLKTGKALKVVSDNVINLNSLQVTFSSRFVYSSHNGFDLVREMLNDQPKFKNGLDFEWI